MALPWTGRRGIGHCRLLPEDRFLQSKQKIYLSWVVFKPGHLVLLAFASVQMILSNVLLIKMFFTKSKTYSMSLLGFMYTEMNEILSVLRLIS